MVKDVNLGGHIIGNERPCFIIAEAGINHNGDINLAFQLVDAGVEAGADAVKFQTFQTESVMTYNAPKADYQKRSTGTSEGQFEMVKRLELPAEAFRQLAEYCHERGIMFLSSPFDHQSVDLLDELGVPGFKVPSGEITNHPMLAHIARKQKPMVVSTGMAHLGEVEAGIRTIQNAGNDELVLLHCVSNYPAEPADVNLRAMGTMARAFALPVGYSDHTIGTDVTIAAVAMGACVIEKHFTLDCNMPGPDHAASLEPNELRTMIRSIRTVEQSIGHGRKEPATSENSTASVARRSLVASEYISKGTIVDSNLIAIKRPGTGLPPSMLEYVLGRKARKNIPRETLLSLDMFV